MEKKGKEGREGEIRIFYQNFFFLASLVAVRKFQARWDVSQHRRTHFFTFFSLFYHLLSYPPRFCRHITCRYLIECRNWASQTKAVSNSGELQ